MQAEAQGLRTLVVTEDAGLVDAHSALFALLKNRGHTLHMRTADDNTVALEKYGEYQYDNIVLLVPTAEEIAGGAINADSLSAFVDAGNNVMLVGGPECSDAVRAMSAEFGLDFDVDKAVVSDAQHFSALDSIGSTFVEANNVLENE